MLDVPVLVKDALREGTYRKNYRFNVGYWGEGYVDYEQIEPSQIWSFANDIFPSYQFKFYANYENAFDSITIQIVSDTTTNITIPAVVEDGKTYALFNTEECSSTTTFYVTVGSVEGLMFSYLANDVWITDFTIDNNNLVKESVVYDERMCSGDILKFGLCEGTSVEFQYFGFDLITGRQIQAFIDVEYAENQWHSIPMGFFTVDKCSRQASTGIIKVTAYNKLQSDYLDEKANSKIEDIFGSGDVYVDDVLNAMLDGFAIKTTKHEKIEGQPITQGLTMPNVSGNFKFTSFNGDDTPFNAHMFVASTQNCYIRLDCRCYKFSVSASDSIRIGIATDLDALDDAIYQLIESSIDKAHLNITTATLMQRIINMDGASQFGTPIFSKYGFQAILSFADGTERRYGKTLYDNGLADGTFKDLSYRTFQGLKTIKFIYPYQLLGAVSSVSIPSVIINFYGDIEGNPLMHSYTYYDANNVLQSGSYSSPTNLSGDSVNLSSFIQKFTASKIQNLDAIDVVQINIDTLSDITLRELQSAVYETKCQFGKLDRETDLFAGVELNQSKLYPKETIYPAANLYPGSSHLSGFKSTYSKLWADEGNVHKWRYLIITYKGLDEQGNETDYTLQRTIDEHGTDNYNCSDNWLFRNLIWAKEDVEAYADAMVEKMQNITWFPFEMWCAGLPYLETGDEIEIPLGTTTYTSYVLQRTLKGIQNLQDTYINGTLDIF